MSNETARWYRMRFKCKECGERPRLRMSLRFIEWARVLEPDEVLQTYECGGMRGRCRTLIPLAAFLFWEADPDAGAKDVAA